MITPNQSRANHQISGVGITNDLLADRGGLLPLMRYLDATGIASAAAAPLAKYRSGAKGLSVDAIVRQVLAFFLDGTSPHLTWFDHLKQDEGYLALLEVSQKEAASSHQIKRLFRKPGNTIWSPYRGILRQMFAARLRVERPSVVELFLDTMVLDNDDALVRQGCEPTYKKVKGFQPLQLIWDGMIVDAQFRGGKKNGNHGLTAATMIKKAAQTIRKVLGYEVPVLVRMDGGFMDGELFWRLDANQIGFVCSGRLSNSIKAFAAEQDQSAWCDFSNERQTWSYFEFATRCLKWGRFYRAIYMKPKFEDEQMVLEFARPEQVLITNMGAYPRLFKRVSAPVKEELFKAESLIQQHHVKGTDELTHRRLKDFASQQLPFKGFNANTLFYYLMVIGFNVMEWYKRDVLVPLNLVGKRSYATTVRRKVMDFGAKIVRSARKTVMKVTKATMDRVNLARLWECSADAPPLIV